MYIKNKNTFLTEEKLIIDALTNFGVLKEKQIEKLISYKDKEVVDSIIKGLRKKGVIQDDEYQNIRIHPSHSPNYDVIKSFWAYLEFLEPGSGMTAYKADLPAEIFFLKGNDMYETVVVPPGEENIVRALQLRNRNISDDHRPTYLLIVEDEQTIHSLLEAVGDLDVIFVLMEDFGTGNNPTIELFELE